MIDIKEFRDKNNITQVELANYLGVTGGFISQVELGKSKLSKDKIEQLKNNDRGWIVDDKSDDTGTIAPLSESEKLYEIIVELQETIKTQRETIRIQSETISKQSETINIMIASKIERH